jgi:type IV pilus assembly protein PilY1
MTAAEQANFANWFSYYRKREYVAKRALSQIIKDSSSRMGLATLHDNNGVRTPITDVDDISTPIYTPAQTNKNNLLRQLFRINSSGDTPLRRSLEDVGEYYEGKKISDLSWGPSPILPTDEGGECQQNFTILMSDGVWNGDDPAVGNADTDDNTDYDGGLYADGSADVSDTLADVAMYYYERDLDTSMPNNVRTILGVDPNTAQHMVTYTVAFGVDGAIQIPPSTWSPIRSPLVLMATLNQTNCPVKPTLTAGQHPPLVARQPSTTCATPLTTAADSS